MRLLGLLAEKFASLASRASNKKKQAPVMQANNADSVTDKIDGMLWQLIDQKFTCSSTSTRMSDYLMHKFSSGQMTKDVPVFALNGASLFERFTADNMDVVVINKPKNVETLDQVSIGAMRNGRFLGEVPFKEYIAKPPAFLIEMIGPWGGRPSRNPTPRATPPALAT